MTTGKLHPAERRLEQALDRGGSDLDRVRELLNDIYQLEVRFDDAKALLRRALADAKNPIRLLKELSNFDLERLPYQGLQGALEKAGRLAPEDERVWLGKSRLAIEAGRWAEAREWLERCGGDRADGPVWKTWIELARGAGRPEDALNAARHLGPAQLNVGESLDLRAWLHRQRGDKMAEAATLEEWLRFDPADTRAMERLAELAHQAGDSGRVTDLRRRKEEVERGSRLIGNCSGASGPLAAPPNGASWPASRRPPAACPRLVLSTGGPSHPSQTTRLRGRR